MAQQIPDLLQVSAGGAAELGAGTAQVVRAQRRQAALVGLALDNLTRP